MAASASQNAAPIARSVRVNGIATTYYEWRAKPGNQEPPLLIAHATGFHGRCYSAIAELFPDRRVIALDLRGHGRSEGEPVEHWRLFVDDVSAFLAQMHIRRAVGVGHSMGAHVLLQCASENPEAFSRLVLFDPVIMAPEYYQPAPDGESASIGNPTIRRKRDFPSPEAMMERFATRDPYNLFDDRVFEDYCRYGLTPREGGDYELACSPEMEASVYASSRSNAGIHEAAAKVTVPVLVVRAQQGLKDGGFKNSPTWPGLAGIIPQGTDLDRSDMTHFHPFQDPVDAARIIAEFEAR